MTKKKAGGRYTPPKTKPEKIRLLGDPSLRAPNGPVEHFDSSLADLAHKLTESLTVSQGAAVAAPQIGVNLQVFVWAEGQIVCNPRIVSASDEPWTFREGCLSIPDMWWSMDRPRYIDIEYQDETGEFRRHPQMEDFQARLFQHEIDHLNGILLIDHLSEAEQEDVSRRLAARSLTGV